MSCDECNRERIVLVTHNQDGTDTLRLQSGREVVVTPQYVAVMGDWAVFENTHAKPLRSSLAAFSGISKGAARVESNNGVLEGVR